MSTAGDTLADVRQAFLAGEIDADELRERLQALDTDTNRDELFVRWAEQGLLDEPIAQDGFTSFKGNRVREVDRNGERSG